MTKSLKERVTGDLQKATGEGKLRAERIREIVKTAVSEAASEVRTGSGEIRSVVRDAIAGVFHSLQERGEEVTEDVNASVQGVIEGISQSKREKLEATQTELQQLQTQMEAEEESLQGDIDIAIADIEETGKDTPPKIQTALNSALENLKDTEEGELMRKRYAQLQAQIAILQANLSARHGERFENVKKHLDTAQSWYERTTPKAEVMAENVKEKRNQFEEKLKDAGTATARKEKQVKQVLKELWNVATETFRDEDGKL